MATPEGQIQAAILAALRQLGYFAWRNPNAPVPIVRGSGTQRILVGFRRNSVTPGVPDIIGLMKPAGRAFAVECKAPGGKLSRDQEIFRDGWVKSGGLYIVGRSALQVITELRAA